MQSDKIQMYPASALPPIHPGKFLREILDDLQMSQAEFARKVGFSPMRISHVIRGDRPITDEMALVFGKVFNQTPQYWLNLQSAYDLKMAMNSMGPKLKSIEGLDLYH